MAALNTMTAPTVLLAIISTLGIFGNFNIAWATWRKPKLRSSCNILIMIAALSDLIHQFAHITWAILYFNNTTTTFEQCYYIQALPMFGANFGSVMLLIIGVDRLICIGKPLVYETMSKTFYLISLLSIGALIPLAMAYSAYVHMQLDPFVPSPCVITGALDPYGLGIFFEVNAVLISSTVLVYALIWIVVKQSNYSRSKQLLRTITAASLCAVGGWFFTMNLATFLTTLGIEVTTIIIMYNGSILNTSVTLNYLIYFVMSREYRQAFLQQLGILSCGLLGRCRVLRIEDSKAFTITNKSRSQTSKSENS